ncbi:PREDICTED: U3 small nucleolar RNA-associated protein 14 homolog B [Ceratosolen solmsi marchali]|uniref:U3 small nucleolar RNA-associated protein 14 homolog B n=1 Tax=Ceratosolen solmsi marchali TaxID=326594 RepID=A0AAJ7E1N9_9HYME|nr:PREDICTED: U3 small nucleolar RNA-associated protein 14 homolog B [Ceratosolen solmsi marchali]
MSGSESSWESEEEISGNHSQLLEAVRQLDKSQRVGKVERSEPSLEVSEFHLVKSDIANEDAVKIDELAKTLKKKGDFVDLGKKIEAARTKVKVLDKPLEKPAAERIKRAVGFQNTKTDLTKWSGIVARNRTAASISFPLSQSSMKLEPSDEYLGRFRIQSELEKKLAEIEPEKKPEEKDAFPLTLQEIIERRREAAKLRAQESYKVAKAHRQNKIKSKKFHRIQRKEKIKQTMKEFEELQKTDPQAALEKLDQLDKTRAEERMTLRHKSTGQWAKNKQVRAKYDKESRQVLAQQLSISRELTQKVKKDDSDEDSDDQPVHLPNNDKENPWLNTMSTQPEIDDFVSRYRKFYDAQKTSEKKQSNISKNTNGNENTVQNNISEDNINNERIINNNVKKVFEEPEMEDVCKSRNPVEKIIEENFPNENGFGKPDNAKRFCSQDKTHKREKKVVKTPNAKLKTNLNKTLKKVAKTKGIKIKAGTSNWFISPIESEKKISNDIKRIDIDEIFDTLENKVQLKVTKKLSKMKNLLNKEIKKENVKKSKRKRGNEDSTNDVEQLGLKGQRNVKPIINKPIEETTNFQPSNKNSGSDGINDTNDFNSNVMQPTKKVEIDPNKFMNVKPVHVKTMLPDDIAGDEDALDDSEYEDQQQIISEAFADDDVVDEFQREKDQEIKKSQPENIDLQLPGWGSWGGKNIKPSTRKKRRFLIKMPKPPPRRDENKGDVVIIEEKCPKIGKHLVSELPFPFTSVQDFEASIRAPLGRDFVPEKTFSKITQPAVKTKMGKVIEPMSTDALISVSNARKIKMELQKKEKKKLKRLTGPAKLEDRKVLNGVKKPKQKKGKDAQIMKRTKQKKQRSPSIPRTQKQKKQRNPNTLKKTTEQKEQKASNTSKKTTERKEQKASNTSKKTTVQKEQKIPNTSKKTEQSKQRSPNISKRTKQSNSQRNKTQSGRIVKKSGQKNGAKRSLKKVEQKKIIAPAS